MSRRPQNLTTEQQDFRALMLHLFLHYDHPTLGEDVVLDEEAGVQAVNSIISVVREGGRVVVGFSLPGVANILSIDSLDTDVRRQRLRGVLNYRITRDDVEFFDLLSTCLHNLVQYRIDVAKYGSPARGTFEHDSQRADINNMNEYVKLIDNCRQNNFSAGTLRGGLELQKSRRHFLPRDQWQDTKIRCGRREPELRLVYIQDTFLHIAIRMGFPERQVPGQGRVNTMFLAAAILGERHSDTAYANLMAANEQKHNALHELSMSRTSPQNLIEAILRGTGLVQPPADGVEYILLNEGPCQHYCLNGVVDNLGVGDEYAAVPRAVADLRPYCAEAVAGLSSNSPYATACRVQNYKGVYPYFLFSESGRHAGIDKLFLPDENVQLVGWGGNVLTGLAAVSLKYCLDIHRQTPSDSQHSLPLHLLLRAAGQEAVKSMFSLLTTLSFIFGFLNLIASILGEMNFCDELPVVHNGSAGCLTTAMVTTAPPLPSTCEMAVYISGIVVPAAFFLISICLGVAGYFKEFREWKKEVYHYHRGNPVFNNECISSGGIAKLFSPDLVQATCWFIFAIVTATALEAAGLASSDTLFRVGMTGSASFLFSTVQGWSTSAVSERTKLYSLINMSPS